jgi:hypothetical protein
MTISTSTVVFPNNVVDICATRLQAVDTDLYVCKRPLRSTDQNQSIGVFAALWSPDEESFEIKNGPQGRSEPSLQRYQITVQAFVKDMDEERGLAVHSVLSKIVRSVLYRDEPLRVGLTTLSTTMSGSTERTTRWSIMQQRYFANEIQGSWLYLSTLDFLLETETV